MPPRVPPTHFLCIPLAAPQLASSLSSFRADVTSLSFNLPDDAVRPPGTLHLTLGVMALTAESVPAAVDLLSTLKPRAILHDARAACPVAAAAAPNTDEKLSITIKGLRSMQEAERASVLYAPPLDAGGVLHEFCHRLRQPFRDRGFMMVEERPLLLHATVFNTVYSRRRRARGRGGARDRDRLTVDARRVLSRYEKYVWAEELPLTRVAICRMGARQIEGTDDAAYEVEAEIEL